MIEIMTGKDVRNLSIMTEHGKFTPIYEYEDYDVDTDTYIGFRVIKTADKVYSEWLETKDLPPVPNEMEVLKEEVSGLRQENKLLKAQVEALSNTADFHEELIVEMANKVYA